MFFIYTSTKQYALPKKNFQVEVETSAFHRPKQVEPYLGNLGNTICCFCNLTTRIFFIVNNIYFTTGHVYRLKQQGSPCSLSHTGSLSEPFSADSRTVRVEQE